VSETLIVDLFVFVLATFCGRELISKVPQTLHTPLMSGSNAISGISLVGAIIAADSERLAGLAPWLGVAAVVFGSINVIGGFLVTDRMLKMFRRH
jgi:NAD(P) transhydrogenase subunit alpha